MTLNINEQERELLLEALRSSHQSLLDEIVHTDGFDYKEMLKQKLERLKALESKIQTSLSNDE